MGLIIRICDAPGQAQRSSAAPQGASGRRRPGDDRRRGFAAALSLIALFLATPAAADADLTAYLRARAADAAGQGDSALAAYRAALAGGSPLVAIRAYREALAAGDLPLARQATAILTKAGVAPVDAALLPLAEAARADDRTAAARATDALGADRLKLLVPSLMLLIGGDAPETADPAAHRLQAETRALLLVGQGRPEGIAAAAPLTGKSFRIAAAELLLGAGRDAEARRIVGDDRTAFAAARAGASGPTLAHGVSRLLLRIADDLEQDRSSPLAIALARSALVADPGYLRAHLVLAEQLGRAGDTDRALAELAQVPGDGPLAAQAAARRVEILNRADRLTDAVAAARALAERDDASPQDRARYADLLFGDGRPAEAVPLYRRVLRSKEAKNSWAAWLRYGGALDEAGRWSDAEKALRRAVKIAPDEPSALNYLGYSLVDRGEDAAEGTAMLERAHRLAPDDAAITDSLGWAYHRAGDTARALPLVEAAAADLPTDPEVNDHLGDIYWTLGRRFEARYAWRAAQLTAVPAARARIAAKVDAGL